MKDEELKLTATWYSSNPEILRDRIIKLEEEKIKQLEERVYELERSIDLIHHILESKQDTNEL